MTKKLMRIGTWCMAACALALAACASDGGPETDLNKAIPALINSWKGPDMVTEAGDLFNSSNPDARRIAVATISQKKWGHEDPYMRAYRVLTRDPDPLVRGQAYRALGSSHQPEVAELLLKGLSDKDAHVREDASAAIGDIQNAIVVEPLLSHLKDDSSNQVRINCTQALRPYVQVHVLRALCLAVDDHEAAVARGATLSLQAMTHQNLGDEGAPWLNWVDKTYAAAPKKAG